MGALLRELVDNIGRRDGLTQADIARKAGVDPTTLNHSFRNVNGAMTVRRICEAFDYHVEFVPNVK